MEQQKIDTRIAEKLSQTFSECETNADAIKVAVVACDYVINMLADNDGFKEHTKALIMLRVQEM